MNDDKLKRPDRPGCLILLEGADASGKTTLAGAILEQAMAEGCDALYLHGRPWVGTVIDEHQRMAMAAAIAGRDTVVVMDHFWIAEQLYGREYRGGPAYDPRGHDVIVSKNLAGLTVLCVPSDFDAQRARHAKRRASGDEEFEHSRGIIKRYSDLWCGNPAHEGKEPFDEVIRKGRFQERPDVWRFDMNHMPAKTGAGLALVKARARRQASEAASGRSLAR